MPAGEVSKKMAVAQSVARETSADAQLVALRVPPHSVEAEQSLLGALLIDNQAFDRIADLVAGEDFYRDDHRDIPRTRTPDAGPVRTSPSARRLCRATGGESARATDQPAFRPGDLHARAAA